MDTLDSQTKPPATQTPEAAAEQGQNGPLDEQIAFRAYLIWENEGHQDGRDQEYWARAERELQDSIEMKKINAGCVDAPGNPAAQKPA